MIGKAARLVGPFLTHCCNDCQCDDGDDGRDNRGGHLRHDDGHEIGLREIRDEDVVRLSRADGTAPCPCEDSRARHRRMYARRHERRNKDAADRRRAAGRARDGDVDPPRQQRCKWDEDELAPRNHARDGLDEMAVAGRDLHDERKAHDRTDHGHE